jgi:molecular chaperone GrpE
MSQPETQNDHIPEDAADGAPAAESAADPRIAELEAKLAEVTDKALRALAEADNVRKRSEKERQDTAKFAVSSFAREVLPVADNLRRALAAITPEQQAENEALKNIYIGVEATERELFRALEKNGVKKIDALDQKFDPNFHEVMFEADVPGKPPGTVIQILEPGYTIHERLLRPARVGVAKGGEAPSGSTIDQEV